MEDIKNYLSIMQEGLEKKITILKSISEMNGKQKTILEDEKMQLEDFEATLEDKGKLVEALIALDNGFEAVYDRVKDGLVANRTAYSMQIKRMQELISEVTDLSVKVQSEEARNKELVQKRFQRLRQNITETRKNSKAVSNYYRSMSRLDSSPQFMDSKK